MKKTNCYILSLLMAAALTACSSDVDQGSTNGLTPISLTATVEDAEVTRAGTTENNAFSSGDAFTAYFPTNVRVGSTTSASSTSFSYNGTKWTPATQPYFNAGASSATVHAYYGKVGGSSGTQVTNSTGTFTVATDQSTSAGYKASDLMYATTNIAKTSPTAALTFQHKMAKIIVSATAGSGISKITAVRIIGGHRSINVTMPGCTLGTTLTDANTSSSYITMYSGGTAATAECAALVVPEASGFTGDFLEIVTDLGSVKYSLTSKVLASGKSYKFVLAVNAAAIGSTVSITSWTETSDATVVSGGGDFTIGDISAYTYDGNAKEPTPTVKYGTTTLTKDSHYTLQYVANTNAGKAAVIAIGKGDYVGKVGVKEFNINKADATVTSAPTKRTGLTYNKSAQALVTAGTPSGGTMMYKVDNGEYSSSLPTATNANPTTGYTVTYYVQGDDNHNDTAPVTISGITIAKATQSVTLSATSLTLEAGQSGTFTVNRGGGDGTITATSSNTSVATVTSVNQNTGVVTVSKVATGDATITITVAASDNYNAYSGAALTVTVSSNPLAQATSADVGKIIGADGKIYATKAAAESANTTAAAMIVYVGAAGSADASSATYKGLAIALTDASTGSAWYGTSSSYSSTCVYQNSTFSNHYGYGDMAGIANTNQMADKTGNCASHTTHAAATAAKNYSSTVAVPANCSQWFLPTSGQWLRFLRNSTLNLTWSDWGWSTGGGSDFTKVNKMFTDAGASGAVFSSGANYWSSSEYSANYAVSVYFLSSNGVYVSYNGKYITGRVRAFLAF